MFIKEVSIIFFILFFLIQYFSRSKQIDVSVGRQEHEGNHHICKLYFLNKYFISIKNHCALCVSHIFLNILF